ncbi:hypothetical protein K1718_13280 [Roseibium porphyridii]|uniref:ArsR family transcriptional regulator n=1 Tax=Roseibium porphyridii TaxID=2866279 RepID=A0ABY8F9W2_9HYPH|nr:hypothetical protein [Roseibium sp. KMA01]WFE92292.1 hypothetical protein K1718_13280 [Roseibium sp. KMA01]
MSYHDVVAEDCRLIILNELSKENDSRLNETILTKVLENFGHLKTRDYVRTQLRKLEDLGAIGIKQVGTVQVAELRQPGLDHVERRSYLEGVGRPSLEG